MFEPAQVVQILVTAADRHGERPLYEALVEACHQHGLAGATVIRNVEGFGDAPAIARGHWWWHEEPVALVIVDQADRLDRFLAAVTPWLVHGMVIRSDVQVRRLGTSASATP